MSLDLPWSIILAAHSGSIRLISVGSLCSEQIRFGSKSMETVRVFRWPRPWQTPIRVAGESLAENLVSSLGDSSSSFSGFLISRKWPKNKRPAHRWNVVQQNLWNDSRLCSSTFIIIDYINCTQLHYEWVRMKMSSCRHHNGCAHILCSYTCTISFCPLYMCTIVQWPDISLSFASNPMINDKVFIT